jgi:cytochrome c553
VLTHEVAMSFRSRLASILSASVLCLLALDGVILVAGPQGTQPPPPPSQPAGQPPPSVRPRMREHFTRGAAIRDAVIRADLEAIRAPATWLAEHPQPDLPPSAQPNVREMQRLAAEVAAASDLAAAARGTARLAAACGSCHTTVNATPTLMGALPRGEDETLAGHMRKHYRAADLLYRGLVVPSTHSWNAGADALIGDPVELELQRGSTPQPDIEALARRLHGLAQEARKAEDSKSRSEVYGQMLATCSDCHKRQNVVIRRGPTAG